MTENSDPRVYLMGEGNIRYRLQKRRINWQSSASLRPEVFNVNNQLFANRFNLRSDLAISGKKINYGIGFRHIRQSFSSGVGSSIDTKLSDINGHFIWRLSPSYHFNVTAAGIQRDVEADIPSELLTGIMSMQLRRRIRQSTWLGLGATVEQFALDGEVQDPDIGTISIETNEGQRFGPRVSLEHRSRHIFSLHYTLLFQRSSRTSDVSEHHWRIFYGRTLLRNVSLLFLVDSYVQSTSETDETELALAYTPLESEDQVYCKLVYNLEAGRSLSARLAWFRNNIPQVAGDFQGVLLTVGIKVEY